MAISFIRVDDRIIHGQVVTRWSMERPCDGIIAVNDKCATNDLLKNALKAASTKKTFIWTHEQFLQKMDEAVKSGKNYFVITKEPVTMAKLLVDNGMTVNVQTLNVGPQSARGNTIYVNKNCDVTNEEFEAYEKIHQAGYNVEFQLVPDSTKVTYESIRNKVQKKGDN